MPLYVLLWLERQFGSCHATFPVWSSSGWHYDLVYMIHTAIFNPLSAFAGKYNREDSGGWFASMNTTFFIQSNGGYVNTKRIAIIMMSTTQFASAGALTLMRQYHTGKTRTHLHNITHAIAHHHVITHTRHHGITHKYHHAQLHAHTHTVLESNRTHTHQSLTRHR